MLLNLLPMDDLKVYHDTKVLILFFAGLVCVINELIIENFSLKNLHGLFSKHANFIMKLDLFLQKSFLWKKSTFKFSNCLLHIFK